MKSTIPGLAGIALLSACSGPPDALLSDTALSAGERAYQHCYACHALSPDETGVEGPALDGVVGRPVASLPGYAYSPAMRVYAAGGQRWTRARLDAFLADPQAEVPGNAMGFFGMRDARERAALIAWLALQEGAAAR